MKSKSNIILILCILTFSILLLSPTLAIKEHFQDSSIMKVYAPDVINVFEPYKIKVVFNNLEMTKGYDLIGVSGSCAIAQEYATRLKKSSPELYDNRHFKYGGEKEVELTISQITHQGVLDLWSVMENGKPKVLFYDCTIILKKSSAITDYSSKVKVDFKPEFYEYSFGIEGLPSGFIPENKDVDTKSEIVKNIWNRYNKKGDNQDISIFMKLQDILDNNQKAHTYSELASPSMDKFGIKITDRTYEEIQVGKETAHIYYYCDRRQSAKGSGYTYYTGCIYDGFILKSFGPVLFQMKAKLINEVESLDEANSFEEDWKNLFIDSIKGSYFKSGGKTTQVEIEEDSDDDCGECKIGYVCSACGKCIKEKDAVNPEDVSVELKLDASQSKKSILNAIESQSIFRVSPVLKLSANGKDVDYCDLTEPGLELTINANMTSKEVYSGFTTGFVNDERTLTDSCKIDLSDSKPKCAFVLSPNDRKKFAYEAKDIIQEVRFNAKIKESEASIEKQVVLTPPKFKLSLSGRTKQVQQGDNGVFEIKTNGATTEKIIVKTNLIGPGKIGLDSKSITQDWILKVVEDGESFKVGYSAPAMGNFDIGKELESLSMVNLQKEAAIAIAIDAVTAYGGDYAGNIEALVEAGEYSAKIGHLTDTFKAVNGARNLIGFESGIPGMQEEVGDAMGVNEQKAEATFTEKAADIGVAGISIAQTAVSVLTFIPNKIPGVNKLSAGVQTAFSAATNIWKANLKYISKSEKIERAKELYYPVPIIVTAQDLSGWTIQDNYLFQIAYHKVD